MKFAIYGHPENKGIAPLEEKLRARGVEYDINPSSCCNHDFALSVGGDGTFLGAMRSMGKCAIPILGINSGRLGFLATVSIEQIDNALDDILKGRYKIRQRMMLSVCGDGVAGVCDRALNEFTVQKRSTSMIYIEIKISGSGELVAAYWADGVIVSTPTGSTAYSMSVGGAILSPDCQCVVISPIAPHNLNIRPLVLPASVDIEVKVSTRHGEPATVTIDNREIMANSNSVYRVSQHEMTLKEVVLDGNTFYDTLRDKLLWGVDLRN